MPSLENIQLGASELASNVIRHANTDFTVRVTTRRNLVRLEVFGQLVDHSRHRRIERLQMRAADHRDGVRALGIEMTENGKTVWVEFSAEADLPG